MKMQPSRKALWFWWLVFIALVVVTMILAAHLSTFEITIKQQPGLYKVTQFIDGDTIAVDMNGSTEIIRMIGVDTPETHHPSLPVQCFGIKAAEYTKSLIDGSRVRLQADPINTNRDRYDRLLRYVYLPDGRLVEEEIIKNGYGFAYVQFPFEKANKFEVQEQQARQAKRGLWGGCEVMVESNGREQTNAAN